MEEYSVGQTVLCLTSAVSYLWQTGFARDIDQRALLVVYKSLAWHEIADNTTIITTPIVHGLDC